MSGAVEKVARALCAASNRTWRTGTYQPGPGLQPIAADPLNQPWRHLARVAIKEMQDAPDDVLRIIGFRRVLWETAIEAALGNSIPGLDAAPTWERQS